MDYLALYRTRNEIKRNARILAFPCRTHRQAHVVSTGSEPIEATPSKSQKFHFMYYNTYSTHTNTFIIFFSLSSLSVPLYTLYLSPLPPSTMFIYISILLMCDKCTSFSASAYRAHCFPFVCWFCV